MDEYEVGYGKPPRSAQFRRGTSGNRTGRPRRKPDMLGELVQGVLDAPVRYRENGRTKTATRRELRLKLLVEKAMKGDVGAAALLLKKRHQALRQGEAGAKQVVVTDWLPDTPCQTAEEKMAVIRGQTESPVQHRASQARAGNGKAASGSPKEQEG